LALVLDSWQSAAFAEAWKCWLMLRGGAEAALAAEMRLTEITAVLGTDLEPGGHDLDVLEVKV
jgi:hypothetical protein